MKTPDETAESFLSGGVDSSYVLAMSDVEDDGFPADMRRSVSTSRGWQSRQRSSWGRKNSRCLITPEEYFGIVPYVMYNMEQPLGDASAIAFAIACRAAAEHTKICYSGEGADEFFGGYNMYRNAERYGENLKDFYVGNTNIMKEDEKKTYSEKVRPGCPSDRDRTSDIRGDRGDWDPLTKMSDMDIQIWLEGDIYLNVDKMSLAAGLEIRMPLTDRRIFDIASRDTVKNIKSMKSRTRVALRTAGGKGASRGDRVPQEARIHRADPYLDGGRAV